MRYFLIGLFFFSPFSFAGTQCPQHFYQGTAPVLLKPAEQIEICYKAFGLLYSKQRMTSFYAGEYLTPERVKMARQLKREDAFHEDSNINSTPTLKDYKGSSKQPDGAFGYDRGHLAPSGNMATMEAQYESFVLTNMVPQASQMNQMIWSQIEEAVRDYVVNKNRSVYIVTGPLYTLPNTKLLKDRISIPDMMYKAVIDPMLKSGAVYIGPNDPSQVWKAISLSDFKRDYGIDITPLSKNLAVMTLPQPVYKDHGNRYRKSNKSFSLF